MNKTAFRIRAFLFASLLLFASPRLPAADSARPRLISLAPSITEAVFAIGAGDLLVGVTEHCRFPPEAESIAKIGGYQSPNFEAILTLRPDFVLTLDEHSPSHPSLDGLGISYVVMDHRTLDGILASFATLGTICGVEERALELRDRLEDALAPPDGYDPASAPSILFIIGRDYGRGVVSNAYVIGRDRLYDCLFAAVGCRNAYTGDLPYPVLSGEGVAALDPDIIVEGVYGEMGAALDEDELLRDWRNLANLRAVRNGRVFYLRADYVFVPGPRLELLRRDLAEAVAGYAPAAAEKP